MHNKLYNSPQKYLNKKIIDLKEDVVRWKTIYYILNIIMIFGATTISIMSALLISKIWLSSYPDWYIYLTTSIGAMTTFFSSIINFFFVKEKYEKGKKQVIMLETLKLINKDDKYSLFMKTAAILENEIAALEVSNE